MENSLLTEYGQEYLEDVAGATRLFGMPSPDAGFDARNLKSGLKEEPRSVSSARLERALQAKKALVERDLKQLRLYKEQRPDQYRNEENKKASVIQNEIKRKELEAHLALESEPVIGKCTIHHQLQAFINCPSQVNADDVLEILRHQNQRHIEDYRNVQYMPEMVRQKRREESARKRNLYELGAQEYKKLFQIQEELGKQQNAEQSR